MAQKPSGVETVHEECYPPEKGILIEKERGKFMLVIFLVPPPVWMQIRQIYFCPHCGQKLAEEGG
jgi:hypothetical protein